MINAVETTRTSGINNLKFLRLNIFHHLGHIFNQHIVHAG